MAVALLLLLVTIASAAMQQRARRTTFNLRPDVMPYPTAMLKVERASAVQPTFFVGRGSWGAVTLDERPGARQEARGVIDLTHVERNDPTNSDAGLMSSWVSREGKVLVEIKLAQITRMTRTEHGDETGGEIDFTASLEGVRAAPLLSFTGTYMIERGGVSLRTNRRHSGDVLTIDASAVTEAAKIGLGAHSAEGEIVTFTLWFEAAQ